MHTFLGQSGNGLSRLLRYSTSAMVEMDVVDEDIKVDPLLNSKHYG